MSQSYELRVLGVLRYIYKNPAGDLSLDALADVASMSRIHCHRVFHKQLPGKPVRRRCDVFACFALRRGCCTATEPLPLLWVIPRLDASAVPMPRLAKCLLPRFAKMGFAKMANPDFSEATSCALTANYL